MIQVNYGKDWPCAASALAMILAPFLAIISAPGTLSLQKFISVGLAFAHELTHSDQNVHDE